MSELPTASEWLDEQLKRLNLSQNKLGEMCGLASSSMAEFRKGQARHMVAVKLANGLGVPATMTLALSGLTPPPARMTNVEADKIAHIYLSLNEADRETLMDYAEHLQAKQRRR